MTDTTPAKATNLIAMYKAAIGEKNQAYYLEKFSRFDEKGGGFHPSWNWGAFIGTFVWALYRKMYGLVFTCLIFIIVFAVAKQVSMVKDYVVFMELALALCFPIFGNALYYRKIKAKVKKAIDSTTDEQYAIQRLNRSSGVHIWVLYSALLFCVVIVAHILWRVYASKNDVAKLDAPVTIESLKNDLAKVNESSLVEAIQIEKSSRLSPKSKHEIAHDLTDSDLNDLKKMVHGVKISSERVFEPTYLPKDRRLWLESIEWKDRNSQRLISKIPDFATRMELLEIVLYESKKADLDPSLVLSLIANLSDFRKYSINDSNARGYMLVSSHWVHAIGDGNESSLFDNQVNVRYGCSILKKYLIKNTKNLEAALESYIQANRSKQNDDLHVSTTSNQIVLNSKNWK